MLTATQFEHHSTLRIELPPVHIDQLHLVNPRFSFRLDTTSFSKSSSAHSRDKYCRKVQAYFSRKQETKLSFLLESENYPGKAKFS